MSEFKCVIFDCDGVLVDSEPIANGIMATMANELGANIDLNYALNHFKGNSLQMCVDAIAELTQNPVPDTFITEYRRRTFEAFKNDIQAVDGIKEVLEYLKIPYCVASSGPENKIRLNLELTGLLPYFDNRIFSCYTINKWKPDPAVFLWAADTLGFQPAECLVVEDSKLGVQAGKSGGFTVYGYTAHDYNNELVDADLRFDKMNDLTRLL